MAPVTEPFRSMVNYSLKIAEPILKGEATEVEVRAHAETEYLHQLQVASADKVWNGPCSNVRDPFSSFLSFKGPFLTTGCPKSGT